MLRSTQHIYKLFYEIGPWYVKFLLKIELEILLIKTTARLSFKIDLGTPHTYPEETKKVNLSHPLRDVIFEYFNFKS